MGHMSLGREGKTHDRRTLRGNLAKANPFAKQSESSAPSRSATAQRLALPRRAGSMIDAGAFLLSRALSRDQSRMLARAADAGVAGIIALTTDAEKAAELSSLVKLYPGALYSAAGVHPDNVKKGLADKAVDALLAGVRTAALAPECVAIFCGLDFSRDIASHFAQEKLFDAQLALAAEMRLPVIVHDVGASDMAAEKIARWRESVAASAAAAAEDAAAAADSNAAGGGAAGGAVAAAGVAEWTDSLGRPYVPSALILGFDGSESALAAYVSAGAHIAVSGTVCDAGPVGTALRAALRDVPLDRLLLASLSPLHTPASIEDEFVRSARNEPSNLPSILPSLASALAGGGGGASALVAQLYDNAVSFFGLLDDSPATVGGAAGDSFSSSASAGAGVGGGADAGVSPANPEGGVGYAGGATGGVGGAEHAAARPSAPADESPLPSVPAAPGGVEPVLYRCRTCRGVLFTDSDILPHSSTGLLPSGRAVAAAARGGGGRATASTLVVSSAPVAGGGGGGKGKKGGGAPLSAAAHSGALSGVSGSAEEVSVGKWREAKGRVVVVSAAEGACRAHLIERQPWMALAPTEPEGSILCPSCSTKLGQYSLSGLKCSCGLLVTPAFKLQKARVDAMQQGEDALEAALHAADLDREGFGGGNDETGRDGDADAEVPLRTKKKPTAMPASKNKGNFSEFRNKNTTPRALQAKSAAGGEGGGT